MNKSNKPVFAVLILLLLANLACGAAAATSLAPTKAPATQAPVTSLEKQPTQAPRATPTTAATLPPQATPTEPANEVKGSGGLEIVSTSSYKNTFGDTHIVGEVINRDSKQHTSIELTIEVKDAAGKSLLKDDSGAVQDADVFYPMLSTLDPGESSPFDYYLDSDAGIPDKFNVTVSGQASGDEKRGQVEVENSQIYDDNNGTIYISGELVNKSESPVVVRNLAGALLDNGKIISAAWSATYASYLQPAGHKGQMDRTPFIISLNNPGIPVKDWKAYIDAEQVEPEDAVNVEVEIDNNYFDDLDAYHIAGHVTNKGQEIVTVNLVAGLYDKAGVILDAGASFVPVSVKPGESVPYEISTFLALNYNRDLADKLDNFTVQMDPYTSYPSSYEYVSLESAQDQFETEGSTLKFNGTVNNTSDKELTDVTIVVAIYNEKEELIAMNWTTKYPEGDSYKAGDSLHYDLNIYLSPKVDPAKVTFRTFVQGVVK